MSPRGAPCPSGCKSRLLTSSHRRTSLQYFASFPWLICYRFHLLIGFCADGSNMPRSPAPYRGSKERRGWAAKAGFLDFLSLAIPSASLRPRSYPCIQVRASYSSHPRNRVLPSRWTAHLSAWRFNLTLIVLLAHPHRARVRTHNLHAHMRNSRTSFLPPLGCRPRLLLRTLGIPRCTRTRPISCQSSESPRLQYRSPGRGISHTLNLLSYHFLKK